MGKEGMEEACLIPKVQEFYSREELLQLVSLTQLRVLDYLCQSMGLLCFER